MDSFRLVQLRQVADGHTEFVDVDLPFDAELLSPPAGAVRLARLGVAESVAVMRADRDWNGLIFHPAPRRQLLTVLAGGWRIRTSRGTARDFSVGDSLLVEDTAGTGHSSRALADGSLALVTVMPEGTVAS